MWTNRARRRWSKSTKDVNGSCTFVTIIGVMEERGLLFGWIKFVGAGGSLSGDIFVDIEKSPIWLLRTIPVEGERTPAPKCPFTVVVKDTAFLSASTMQKWLVPWSLNWLHLVIENNKFVSWICMQKQVKLADTEHNYEVKASATSFASQRNSHKCNIRFFKN